MSPMLFDPYEGMDFSEIDKVKTSSSMTSKDLLHKAVKWKRIGGQAYNELSHTLYLAAVQLHKYENNNDTIPKYTELGKQEQV